MTPLPTGDTTMSISHCPKTLPWVAAALAFAVATAGPLASWTAVAQAQTPAGGAQQAGMEPTENQKTGAALMNVVHVPGKVIVCGLGALSTVGILLLSLGSGYRRAAEAFEEGCGGDWVITGEHLSGKIQSKSDLD